MVFHEMAMGECIKFRAVSKRKMRCVFKWLVEIGDEKLCVEEGGEWCIVAADCWGCWLCCVLSDKESFDEGREQLMPFALTEED